MIPRLAGAGSAAHAHALARPTCCSLPGQARPASSLLGRSSQGQRPQGSQRVTCKSSDRDRDWDGAWSEFKKGIPEVESRVRTEEAPRRASAAPRAWNSGPTAGQIRKQELGLINLWGQDLFFKWGGALAIVLAVALILLAGPPPSDSRCTLPWC